VKKKNKRVRQWREHGPYLAFVLRFDECEYTRLLQARTCMVQSKFLGFRPFWYFQSNFDVLDLEAVYTSFHFGAKWNMWDLISGSLKLWHCKNNFISPRNENSCKRPLRNVPRNFKCECVYSDERNISQAGNYFSTLNKDCILDISKSNEKYVSVIVK